MLAVKYYVAEGKHHIQFLHLKSFWFFGEADEKEDYVRFFVFGTIISTILTRRPLSRCWFPLNSLQKFIVGWKSEVIGWKCSQNDRLQWMNLQ